MKKSLEGMIYILKKSLLETSKGNWNWNWFRLKDMAK